MELLRRHQVEQANGIPSHGYDLDKIYQELEEAFADGDNYAKVHESILTVSGTPGEVTDYILDAIERAVVLQEEARYAGLRKSFANEEYLDLQEVADNYVILAMRLGQLNVAAANPWSTSVIKKNIQPHLLKRTIIDKFEDRTLNTGVPNAPDVVERVVEIARNDLDLQERRVSEINTTHEHARSYIPSKKVVIGSAAVAFTGLSAFVTPAAAAPQGMTVIPASSESSVLPGIDAPVAPSLAPVAPEQRAQPTPEAPAEEAPEEAPEQPANVLPGIDAPVAPSLAPTPPEEDAVELDPARTPEKPDGAGVLPGFDLPPSLAPEPVEPPVQPAPPEEPREPIFIPAEPRPEPPAPKPPKEQPRAPEQRREGVDAQIAYGYSLDQFAGFDQCMGEWGDDMTNAGMAFCRLGCGPTNMAEVVRLLGGHENVTPKTMLDKVNAWGEFSGFGTSFDTNVRLAGEYGVRAETVGYAPSVDQIREVIRQGGIVMLAGDSVDPYVPTGQAGAHFLMVRAVTHDGNFLIYNPYSRVEGTWNSDPNDTFNKTKYQAEHIQANSFGAVFMYK